MDQQNANSPRRPWAYVVHILKLISVEPTMVLYMMAFMTTTVVEQQFFVDKACRVNHNLSQEICDNLRNDSNIEYNKEVQITVSNFHQWNDIASQVGPIILAFFMGSWSDRRGRKLPLLMGLVGKLYYSVMVVVNATQDTWPVEYIVYTASLPMAFTGADVAIFAACFSYISDVTSVESRTLRITILDAFYLSTMPAGIALGAYLYKVVNKSYAIMFTINSSLLVCAVIYTLLNLKWQSNSRQRPLREANNVITDFFDGDHVVQSLKTLLQRRELFRRAYLWVFIISMALYTFQRDEKPMAYLYMQLVFKWSVEAFSNFKTFQSALQVLAMLAGIPLMSTLLGWHDTYIIMVGTLGHALARVVWIFADREWLFYLGGAISSIGPVVGPVLRSMTSKLVPANERGKVFSLLSVADNAVPLLAGVCYTQIYNHTIHTHPTSIFYLTMGTQMTVFLLILLVKVTAKDGALQAQEDEELQEKCLPENPTEKTDFI